MRLSRRRFLRLAGLAALPAVPRHASAQAYPVRLVRLIVGFAPGGSTDITARLMGQWLSERLGRQFVIENRPGAGTNLATELVVNAAPDGYTLLLVGASAAINAALYEKLNFNFLRDIGPVGSIVRVPNLMVVGPTVAANTLPAFIAYAKAHPGAISMASGGNGSAPHVAGELFKLTAGVDLVHVPYRGEGPALVDLLGGQVQVCFPTLPAAVEYVRAGKLRALAVTSAERLDALPGVPTVGEFVPGYVASFWYGIGAPIRTPPEIVERLNREVNAGLADPTLKQRFAQLGGSVFAGSPVDFGNLIAAETEKWGKLIRAANIKAE
jgi:tripartite-type tricarboxylate transporter receptor subunit TctC